MIQYVIKVVISALLIVAISELSKRSSSLGGLLASLPLVSLLALIWLYMDTKDTAQVANLSTSIFWLVLPSLSLFLILPQLLKYKMNFYLSLSLSIAVMFVFYFSTMLLLKKLGLKV